MGFLADEDTQALREMFGGMAEPVTVHLVTDDTELKDLMADVCAAGGDKVSLVLLDPTADAERMRELGIERHPGMALSSANSRGKLHFYGHPFGYEMATLVAAITDLGSPAGSPAVSPTAQAALDAMDQDVHIQVFSTPG
jgi:hypothetical protein